LRGSGREGDWNKGSSEKGRCRLPVRETRTPERKNGQTRCSFVPRISTSQNRKKGEGGFTEAT